MKLFGITIVTGDKVVVPRLEYYALMGKADRMHSLEWWMKHRGIDVPTSGMISALMLATTLLENKEKLADAVFGSPPMLSWMISKTDAADGGKRHEVELNYRKEETQ